MIGIFEFELKDGRTVKCIWESFHDVDCRVIEVVSRKESIFAELLLSPEFFEIEEQAWRELADKLDRVYDQWKDEQVTG